MVILAAGTADALLQVLEVRPEWSGSRFSVCNSDNLYSAGTLEKLRTSSSPSAMPCYDKNGLVYPEDSMNRFAVISVSEGFTVTGIVEKPTDVQVEECTSGETVFVSMNLFKLDYMMALTAFKKVPYSPKRNEKELPSAIDLMILENPGCIQGIPVYEHVPDLTSARDMQTVADEISG